MGKWQPAFDLKSIYQLWSPSEAEKRTESDTEQFEEYHDEELESGSIGAKGSLSITHGVYHEDPVHNCAQNRIWDFSDELTKRKHIGRVDTTGSLCEISVTGPSSHCCHAPRMKTRRLRINIGSSWAIMIAGKMHDQNMPNTLYCKSLALSPRFRKESEI